MTSILEFILTKQGKLGESWRDDLKKMNILDDLSPLYDISKSDFEINTIFSFIVLAYDHKSDYIDIHKDRIENKKKIIISIAGLSALSVDIFKWAVYRKSKDINQVIDWYIDYQKDWRWKHIHACFEYHSEVMQMKPTSLTKEAKETLDIGKCINEAMKLRREGDKLLEEIRNQFVNLDDALSQEKRPKITEVGDFMSHEEFIKKKES